MGLLGDIARRLSWIPLIHMPVMFPLTMRHYYALGDDQLKNGELDSPESWDRIRETNPHFVIPSARQDWLDGLYLKKDGQDHEIQRRALDICLELRKRKITTLHSAGVGGGALEYFIKQEMPELHLTASDFNPEGVARLKQVFTECDNVVCFDITKNDWFASDCILFYRIDPHLTNEQWISVFDDLANAGIKNVIYIPATEISVQYLAYTLLKTAIARMMGNQPVFTGYMRSAKVFPTFWKQRYISERIHLGLLPSYWLRLKP